MRKVSKKTFIISLIACTFIFVLALVSSYSILQRINAKKIILNDTILSSQFNNIQAVEYKGNNTFLINTEAKQFIVIRENISFMNYIWKVFEYKTVLSK